MVWTTPVAVFFSCIVLALGRHDGVGAQVAHHAAQGLVADRHHARRRLFIGLLIAAYINLAFIGLAGKFAEWSRSTASRASGSASSCRWACWR
jgi:predicted small integral membrane protein